VYKILHVTPSYFPAIQFGGPIQSVHLLNKTLVSKGVEVDVFTTNAGIENNKDYSCTKWSILDGVKVKYFPYYGYIHYNFSPQLWKMLKSKVSQYDLVHITAVWNFPVWAAARACQQAGIPYIISPRGTIYPETIALKSSHFKKFYYRFIAKQCLNLAATIHYTAKDEKYKVEASLKLAARGIIIPNGIDLSEFAEVNKSRHFNEFFPEIKGKKYILFLSRINQKKGLNLLVEAFATLTAKFPELYLVIAGPDNEGYGTIIKTMLAEKGVLQQTFFTGLLNGEKKIAAYRDAELFVLPSYSENFGMSVVEAMACGTAVIVSEQVGISPDIQAQEAGLVVKTNPNSISESIALLLENTYLKKKIAGNGRQMANNYYNIHAVASKFIEQYKSIIYERNKSTRKNYA
jgi:glycosyltransferase involved in cell wall biosynthesis